jgi:peroxiredoxin
MRAFRHPHPSLFWIRSSIFHSGHWIAQPIESAWTRSPDTKVEQYMTVTTRGARRLRPGDRLDRLALTTIAGGRLSLPNGEDLIHVHLLRFAGCPVCTLHVHAFTGRHAEIELAGVRSLLVYPSTRQELARYQPELPFDVVADPERSLFRRLGAESSVRAVLDPRAWGPSAVAIAQAVATAVRERRPIAPRTSKEGSLGLPADLLIAPDGEVVGSKYGAHAADHWTVDEVIAAAAAWRLGSHRLPN